MRKALSGLLAALCLLLSACGSQTAGRSKYEVVVVPQAWSQDVNETIDLLREQWPELNIYQNTSQEADSRYQALLVEDLVAQGVDVICIDPVDPAATETQLQKAEQAGLLVIEGEDVAEMLEKAALALTGK